MSEQIESWQDRLAMYRYKSQTRERAYVRRRRCLTLIESIAVVLIIVGVVVYVLFPRTRVHTLSKRLVCQSNLKGIGTAVAIYANENNERWPGIAFDESAIGKIKYTVPVGGGAGTVRSPSRTLPSMGGPGGATELSLTRAYWMLVRSGSATVRQLICPTSDDTEDPTLDFELYYDFSSYANISYGLHVRFGPANTRIGPGVDNRMVVAADKGPYVDATVPTPPPDLTASAPREKWRPFSSPNHGKLRTSGQNVLFTDGHATFARKPIVGVDHDNIYTAALDNVHAASRVCGESPWVRNAHPYAPVAADGTPLAGTDSLIFP